MTLAFSGCGSPIQTTPETTGPQTTAPRANEGCTDFLIGDATGTAALQRCGCRVRTTGQPEEGDFLVLAVSCRMGIQNRALDELNRCAGRKVRGVILLLTETGGGLDPELIELVELECKEALTPVVGGDAAAERMPVLRAEAQDFEKRLKDLLSGSSQPVTLGRTAFRVR
jgi:hypothetical protein